MIGRVLEVLVEGYNSGTGQWIGRTAQNRVLNFVAQPRVDGSVPAKEELYGRYLPVRVTRAGPNSLAGECAIAV
jgi:tRNA-2-methylthio-N6-dimethylallyladenosine synthase